MTDPTNNPVQPPANEQETREKWVALMTRLTQDHVRPYSEGMYSQLEPESWVKAALSHGMSPGFAFMVAWVKFKPVITSDILDPLFACEGPLDGRVIREMLVREMHQALHRRMYVVEDMQEALAIANLTCKLAGVDVPADPEVNFAPYFEEEYKTWPREVFKEISAFVQRSIPAPVEEPAYGQMGALFLQANGSRVSFQNAISSMPEGVQGPLLEAWDHWVAHQAARKEMERQPRYAEEPPVFEPENKALVMEQNITHDWCLAKVEHALVEGFESARIEHSSTDWIDTLPSSAEQEWDVAALLGEAFMMPAVSFLWETFTAAFMQNILARVSFEEAIPALDFDGALQCLYNQLAVLNASELEPQSKVGTYGEYITTLTELWEGTQV